MILVFLLPITDNCSGHTDSVLGFAQSADGKRVVTASDDGHCKVFDLDKVLAAAV